MDSQSSSVSNSKAEHNKRDNRALTPAIQGLKHSQRQEVQAFKVLPLMSGKDEDEVPQESFSVAFTSFKRKCLNQVVVHHDQGTV
jgi:hypothetical protein